jgi:hypothetical protein
MLLASRGILAEKKKHKVGTIIGLSTVEGA